MSVLEILEAEQSQKARHDADERAAALESYRTIVQRDAAGEALDDDADDLRRVMTVLGLGATEVGADIAAVGEVLATEREILTASQKADAQSTAAKEVMSRKQSAMEILTPLMLALEPKVVFYFADQLLSAAIGHGIPIAQPQMELAALSRESQSIETDLQRQLDAATAAPMALHRLKRNHPRIYGA